MKILGARADALTLAFRVQLDPELVVELKRRQEVANKHSRAAFVWTVEVPDTEMGDSKAARLGPLRARWANDFDRIKRVQKLWGELRYTPQRGVYRIDNDPFFRIQIKERAEGGGALRDCSSCKGIGWRDAPSLRCPVALQRERCGACDGAGHVEEPGFTFEIVWRAQALASSGLDRCIEESAAIAAMCGDVLDTRLRRLDLCCDVMGWQIAEDDLWNLDKRPRASWIKNPHDFASANDVDEGWESPKKRRKREPLRRESYGRGAREKRQITGISVGRGGPFQSRIYDKRAELELDTIGARREAEEGRWRAQGWDGEAPVARVEFQMRGEVLTELGIRDPDACLEPIVKHDAYTDRKGKRRIRHTVVGQRVITVENDGSEVQARLSDRVDAIWALCLDWIRLVVPQVSRNGNPICVSRLKDDPRWALLRTAKFNEKTRHASITRYRPRKAASAAQALGVSLSQAAVDGRIHEYLPEDLPAYADDARAESRLLARVLALKVEEARRTVRWLIERYGGVAEASVHFAVRQNAARAKRYAGVECVIHQESRPPPIEPPLFERDQVAKVA
ncbi:MAG TPA: hypothetical protein VM925_21780 [Labilithrix sp.]|nr:hypothetical protein [Labilithrix sp.]